MERILSNVSTGTEVNVKVKDGSVNFCHPGRIRGSGSVSKIDTSLMLARVSSLEIDGSSKAVSADYNWNDLDADGRLGVDHPSNIVERMNVTILI